MKILILILAGIAGGLPGGMGMGGGTLLIPLLTMGAGLNQHAAQAINLVAFVPTSVVALILHAKNKLVRVKAALIVGLPAAAASVLASLAAGRAAGATIGRCFGFFLMAVGAAQLFFALRGPQKDKPALVTDSDGNSRPAQLITRSFRPHNKKK